MNLHRLEVQEDGFLVRVLKVTSVFHHIHEALDRSDLEPKKYQSIN